MCNPQMVTGESVLGARTASAVLGTAGSFFDAQGKKTALNASAAVADINAKLAELSAQTTIRAGQAAEQRARITTANNKSKARAAMGANGIDLNSDSAARILTATDVIGEIDANTIAANASREAWGYRVQGMNYTNEAIGARATAKGISPFFSALPTALSGASDVAFTSYKLGKEGAIPKDAWYNLYRG